MAGNGRRETASMTYPSDAPEAMAQGLNTKGPEMFKITPRTLTMASIALSLAIILAEVAKLSGRF